MSRLRAALPTVAKKFVWDMKYGLLGYPQLAAPKDAINYLSTRLGDAGDLLELGCGRGCLARALRQNGWQGYYCGVDISARAIEDARRRGDQRSSWVVSDFESFRSPFQWTVIAMIESVYYARIGTIPTLLDRLANMLAQDGTLLVRLHDVEKHHEYVKKIQLLSADAEWSSENLLSCHFRGCVGPPDRRISPGQRRGQSTIR